MALTYYTNPKFMKRTMYASCEHNGAHWIIGGWDGTYHFFDVWRSTDMQSWQRVFGPTVNLGPTYAGDNIFDRRSYFAAISYNGELHFFGGYNDLYPDNASKVLRDHWSTRTGAEWTRHATPPWEAREAYGLVVNDNKVVLIGGVTYINPDPGWHLRAFSDIWAMDSNYEWQLVCANAPFGKRRSMGCVAIDGAIYVFGGFNSQNVLQADMWKSVDGGATWTQLATPPWSARGPFHYCEANGKAWVLGGNTAQLGGSDLNDVWSFDPFTETWTSHGNATWAPRVGSQMFVKRGMPYDEMFIVGGMSGAPPYRTYYGDVWSSTDGTNWIRNNASTLDVD
jgi:hypothetical protein